MSQLNAQLINGAGGTGGYSGNTVNIGGLGNIGGTQDPSLPGLAPYTPAGQASSALNVQPSYATPYGLYTPSQLAGITAPVSSNPFTQWWNSLPFTTQAFIIGGGVLALLFFVKEE
jgi:hypothetical protein